MKLGQRVGGRALAAIALIAALAPPTLAAAAEPQRPPPSATTTTTTAAPSPTTTARASVFPTTTTTIPTVWINPNYTGAPWDYQVRAFLPFGDTNWYYVINGGICEYTNAWPWTLTGGAALVAGNEPWNSWGYYYGSLQLPPGGGATVVPSTINTADHIRFFVKPPGRSDAQLKVRVTVGSADPATYGQPRTSVDYTIAGNGSAWAPTAELPVPNALGANGLQTVSLSFSVVGPGTWQVDNILMDPWRNN
jgi:hypothetical protein